MANWIAVQLDRSGRAEMSCIAGVGGDVPSLVRVATSGRPVVAVDGCVLACTRHSLARHDVEPAVHVLLSDSGVRKRKGVDFDPQEAVTVLAEVRARIEAIMPAVHSPVLMLSAGAVGFDVGADPDLLAECCSAGGDRVVAAEADVATVDLDAGAGAGFGAAVRIGAELGCLDGKDDGLDDAAGGELAVEEVVALVVADAD